MAAPPKKIKNTQQQAGKLYAAAVAQRSEMEERRGKAKPFELGWHGGQPQGGRRGFRGGMRELKVPE